MLSLEVTGQHRIEAHFEDAPCCQPQEKCDVVFDKNNGFGSSLAEDICCEMGILKATGNFQLPSKWRGLRH